MDWTVLNPTSPRPVIQARGAWGALTIMPPTGQVDPVSRITFTGAAERSFPWDLGQVRADLWLAIHGCELLMQPLPEPASVLAEQLEQTGFTLVLEFDSKRLYRKPWGRRGFFSLTIDATHLSLSFEKRHNACAYTLGNFIWNEAGEAIAWPAGEPPQLALRWALMLVEHWDPEQVFGPR